MKLSPLQIPMELAYQRRGLFAVELLDAATLERVNQGITVTADGLLGKPVINSGGLFAWLDEDFRRLKRIVVDPGLRPYEAVELPASQVEPRKVNSIELSPSIAYPFPAGLTVLRGRLIEQRVSSPRIPTPVVNATVRLRWRPEENDEWRDSPTLSHTNETGDFATFLRLRPTEAPQLDPDDGKVIVQLRVSRPGLTDRTSPDFKLVEGRTTNPTSEEPQTFAWNELTLRAAF
jgi:hypothetical protein